MGKRTNSNLDPHRPSKASPPGVEHTLEVSLLQVNTQLDQDIFDQRGILLLSAGSTISKRLLRQLRRRRITTVIAKSSSNTPTPSNVEVISDPSQTYPTGPFETATTKDLDTMIENSSFEELWSPKSSARQVTRLELNELREEVKAGLKCVEETAKYYEKQVGKVSRGKDPTRSDGRLRPKVCRLGRQGREPGVVGC